MTSLVTFGETMLRLTPPQGTRLTRAKEFDVHVGGAESNVAVAATALGAETAWLSALPDTDLGKRVRHAIASEGVRPAVAWTDDGRVGTYYLEPGGQPRGSAVVYDRTRTPIRTVDPEELPLQRVGGAKLWFTSGITPALSERLAATTASLLERAGDRGATTAFDLNYRSKLWSPADARETLTGLFEHVDVLIIAERDARTVLGVDGDSEAIARTLASGHGFETVVVTQGSAGALAVAGGAVYDRPAVETDTIDPVGSGDAFVGGYLARRLEGAGVGDALEWGIATAALKRTLTGDMAILSRKDVDAVVSGDGSGAIER